MIGRLTGTVATEEADGAVVLDVQGVGYEVSTPLGTVGRARALGDGDRVTLHVHTHVREDALTLFGFASLSDRSAFRALIGVSNVGPKIALAVLSALGADELARAVSAGDAGRLHAISGVGAKTAHRLLLELEGKLAVPDAPARAAAAAPTAPAGRAASLGAALAGLGFRPAEVERATSALASRPDDIPLAQLVREALALLTR